MLTQEGSSCGMFTVRKLSVSAIGLQQSASVPLGGHQAFDNATSDAFENQAYKVNLKIIKRDVLYEDQIYVEYYK